MSTVHEPKSKTWNFILIWSSILGFFPWYETHKRKFVTSLRYFLVIFTTTMIYHAYCFYQQIILGVVYSDVIKAVIWVAYSTLVLLNSTTIASEAIADLCCQFLVLDKLQKQPLAIFVDNGYQYMAVNLLCNAILLFNCYISQKMGVSIAEVVLAFLHQHYSLNAVLLQCFMANLVLKRAKLLNNSMEKLLVNDGDVEAEVERLVKMHSCVADLVELYNSIFGWQLLFEVVIFVLYVLELVVADYGRDGFTGINVVVFVWTHLQYLLQIGYMSVRNNLLHSSLATCVVHANEMYHKYGKEPNHSLNFRVLLQQTMARCPKISAAQFLLSIEKCSSFLRICLPHTLSGLYNCRKFKKNSDFYLSTEVFNWKKVILAKNIS